MVISLQQGANDLHKNPEWFTFLVLAYLDCHLWECCLAK